MSLISLVVGLGLSAIVVFFAMRRVSNTSKEQRYVDYGLELISLRGQLIHSVDCAETIKALPGGTCSVGSWIAVMSKNAPPANVLIQNGGAAGLTKIGHYTLRASCASCPTCSHGKKILIGAAVKTDGTSFAANPLTGKPMSWVDVFQKIPLGCALPP